MYGHTSMVASGMEELFWEDDLGKGEIYVLERSSSRALGPIWRNSKKKKVFEGG